MAEFRIHKLVSALPDVLEPNALYLVRAGMGFDLYATNAGGLITAYTLNNAEETGGGTTGGSAEWGSITGIIDSQLDLAMTLAGKANSSDIIKGLSSFVSGKPGNDEVVGGGISPYAFDISTTNSSARATIAASGSTTFIIRKNGVQIGTIVFAAGATTGTINITTSPTIAINDNVTIHGPATADANLANITFLLRA